METDELKKRYEEALLKQLRNKLCEIICDYHRRNGFIPAAIVANNHAFRAIRADRYCIEFDRDRNILWRGILLLPTYLPGNNIYLCPELIQVMEFPPRKEE